MRSKATGSMRIGAGVKCCLVGVRVCVRVFFLCACVCVCLCAYVCMYVRMCVYIYIYTHTYIYAVFPFIFLGFKEPVDIVTVGMGCALVASFVRHLSTLRKCVSQCLPHV
jgi:hypothetical protein